MNRRGGIEIGRTSNLGQNQPSRETSRKTHTSPQATHCPLPGWTRTPGRSERGCRAIENVHIESMPSADATTRLVRSRPLIPNVQFGVICRGWTVSSGCSGVDSSEWGISKRPEAREKHAFWPLCPAIPATAHEATLALRSSPLNRPPIARRRGCSRSGPPVSRCHDAPPTGSNTARGDGTRGGRAAGRDPHTPDSIAEYRETSSGPGAVHPLRPGS
jgi:hypothetical protein